MQMFADYAEEVKISSGQVVIKEGEDGSGSPDGNMYFYIVAEGKLKYTQKGKPIAGDGPQGAGPGDSFGELALLSNCPRAATVTATEACKLYQVDRDTFRFMMKEATIHQTEEVIVFLRKLEILKSLDDTQMEDVASAVIAQDYRGGETVFSEGDEGNIFYMIQSGMVAVKQAAQGMNDVRLGKDQYFGEKALETGDVRNATIECVEPSRLLLLSRQDFNKVVGSLKDVIDAKHNERVINSVEFLSGLPLKDRQAICEKAEEKDYQPGYCILDEHKEDSKFYIIKSGTVSMNSAGATSEIQSLRAGDYFNIQVLLGSSEHNQWPTCIARDTVTCFVVEREVMRKISKVEQLATDAYNARMNMIASAKQNKVPFKQLQKIANLGQGSFGRVTLVQDKKNKKNIFALKALHKQEIVHYQQQANTINEKEVMMVCHHPFILQLHNTYKDSHRIFFLLEFCNGGELFSRLHTVSRDGVEEIGHAKFYVGCVAQALSYMLDRNIMYRDLKPENMLIDSSGYIKVCINADVKTYYARRASICDVMPPLRNKPYQVIDFGFAKQAVMSTGKKKRTKKTHTQCGTPEYMAPEIVLNRGYDISVDWWALGVLMFECLAGESPFVARSGNEIMKNIIERKFEFPKRDPRFDDQSKNLINSLLSMKPKDRLMMGPSKAQPVLQHPWFEEIDWRKLIAKSIPAPWRPHATGPTDTRYFDSGDMHDAFDKKWKDPNPGWDATFAD